ncbi:MAG: hypothetical protein K0R43_3467 [Pseudoduganella sp.]|jgi:hypothetical protein|nr:hypothetical protein [Pseudoduganella sp.]
MGTAFWIKRFLVVLAGAFIVIGVAQLLKGHDLAHAATQAAIWAAIGASIFTGARYWQARKGRHCALCRDTPEMREES